MSDPASVGVRRPQRADARRNFESVLDAARDVFATDGINASLEEIARKAGVGIGTLYRNFPTRADLIGAVYLDEVDALCAAADGLEAGDPWESLTVWLRRFVDYAAKKRALIDGLNHSDPIFTGAKAAMQAAGGPLLVRAQEAGVVRPDTDIDDVMRLITGITSVGYVEDAQRERVLGLALDGIRAR